MRLVFIGPPGSGKGTQSKLLKERLELRTIGTGDMLRVAAAEPTELGQTVAKFMQSGSLVPDGLVNDLVSDLFRAKNLPTKFVMDGYPRNLSQARSFDEILKKHHLDIQAVIHFKVPEDEIVRRLGGRKLEQNRADDSDETVLKRLRVYNKSVRSLVDYYRKKGILKEIDATKDVESVYKAIVESLNG